MAVGCNSYMYTEEGILQVRYGIDIGFKTSGRLTGLKVQPLKRQYGIVFPKSKPMRHLVGIKARGIDDKARIVSLNQI